MLVGRGRREMEWTGDTQRAVVVREGCRTSPCDWGVSHALAHGRVAPEGRGYRRDSSSAVGVLRIAPIRAQIPRLTHRCRRQERYGSCEVRRDENETFVFS